ncbi:MAG: hypothetical protein CMD67_10215 [Gammaproteobacteria bacterium]|nr:hypothetical protein [Gammaproteobacteria bacterium]
MNVIILAAGQGSRLKPLTNQKPKCLVELFGKSLLKWQLDLYQKLQINDISIVTGYLKEKIFFPNIKFFENNYYDTTNMVETLFCAREKINNSTIISYGDIIYEESVIKKLIENTDDISLIVDKNWKDYWSMRFENPISDLESLLIDSENNISSIGQKIKDINEIQGQYIGLMKFQNNGSESLKSFYDKCKSFAKNGKNHLNSNLSFENSYMTDLLQGMIDDGYKIRAIPVSNGWLELDSYDDYIKYNTMYENKTISRFFNPIT